MSSGCSRPAFTSCAPGGVEANLGHLLLEEPVIPYLEDLLEEKRQGKEHSRTKMIDVARTWNDVQGLQEALELAGLASHLPDEPSARGDLHNFVIRERLKSP